MDVRKGAWTSGIVLVTGPVAVAVAVSPRCGCVAATQSLHARSTIAFAETVEQRAWSPVTAERVGFYDASECARSGLREPR